MKDQKSIFIPWTALASNTSIYCSKQYFFNEEQVSLGAKYAMEISHQKICQKIKLGNGIGKFLKI